MREFGRVKPDRVVRTRILLYRAPPQPLSVCAQDFESLSGSQCNSGLWFLLDVHTNRPDEAQKLASNGRDDLLPSFPSGHELAITMEEPVLGSPGDLLHRLSLAALTRG